MVTAELTGTQLSEPAARAFASDLARYPEGMVLGALTRCRREVRSRLTPADVILRLDDGRPGPEEAWAALPFDEAATVVWTDEMSAAWGVALPLMEEGDRIAARMAFVESYRVRVQRARDAGIPVRWCMSPGTNPEMRQAALHDAVQRGRIAAQYAARLGYWAESGGPPLMIAEHLAKRLDMKGGES